jgi:hypothetical protein
MVPHCGIMIFPTCSFSASIAKTITKQREHAEKGKQITDSMYSIVQRLNKLSGYNNYNKKQSF